MGEVEFWAGTEQSHPGGERLTVWLLEQAEQQGGLLTGGSVLDVGCGQGRTIEILEDRGYRADGIDLKLPYNLKRHGLLEGDFLNCPIRENTYNGVMLECTLCLMEEEGAFRQISGCLKKEGVLLISDIYPKDQGIPDYSRFGFHQIAARDCGEEWKSYVAYWIWNYGSDVSPSCLCETEADWKNYGYYAGIYKYQPDS